MFNVQELEIASSRIVALECKVNTNERVYLHVVGAYLPANNNIEMYKDELSLLQDFYNCYSKYWYVVIAGDFNASCLETDNGRCNFYKSRELRNFVIRNHFILVIGCLAVQPLCATTLLRERTAC